MAADFLPYNPRLTEIARKLRKNMTYPEVILWQYLKGKQMEGYDFDRQRPIDEYIVDFYCKKLMLAIEIDGSCHDGEEAQIQDKYRQERLEALGVHRCRYQKSLAAFLQQLLTSAHLERQNLRAKPEPLIV